MYLNEYIRATGIYTLFVFSISILNPVLAPYVKGLGFDDVQISLIFSVMPLVLIFLSPMLGRISDLTGRRVIILMGISCEIAAILLYLSGAGWLSILVLSLIHI